MIIRTGLSTAPSLTRRMAGRVDYTHQCCFHCSICRWFRLAGEGKGRNSEGDKAVSGGRWYLSGEWRQRVENWKSSGAIVGAVNQDVVASRSTPSPFDVGTGQAAPEAVYPNPHN